MNAPLQISNVLRVQDNPATPFYRLRSEIIDTFADIERAVLKYCHDHNYRNICATAPLKHKIEAAKLVKAGPQRSKTLKANADLELDCVATLLPTRAAIVHSRIVFAATASGDFLAVFKNCKGTLSGTYEALVFTESDLADFLGKLETLTGSLSAALIAKNPPPKPKT